MKSGMNGKSVDSNFIFQYIFLVILYLFILLKYFQDRFYSGCQKNVPFFERFFLQPRILFRTLL